MRCQTIRKWLSKDPEDLTPQQKDQLTAHLKSCKECSRIDQRLEGLAKALQSFREEKIPPKLTEDLWPSIHDRIRVERKPTKEKSPSARPKIRPAFAWGISSLTILSLLLWMTWTQPWKYPSTEMDTHLASIDVVVESAQIDGEDAQIAVFEALSIMTVSGASCIFSMMLEPGIM